MNQRSVISQKNKYWIPKHRYLELKHYCMQYPEWKSALRSIALLQAHSDKISADGFSDPTNSIAIKELKYKEKMQLVESVAIQTDPEIAKWIIEGVINSYSYEYLKYQLGLPAGRDLYYDRYRKFFWLLDQRKA